MTMNPELVSSTTPVDLDGDLEHLPGSVVGGSPGWRRTWRAFLRQRAAVAALVFLLIVVAAAIAAPLLARQAPEAIGGRPLASYSGENWLGTDALGRDLFSRLLYGLRTSLFVSGMTVLLSVVAGSVIGIVSGYVGGRVDFVVMRVVDGFLAFPGLLVAMAIIGVLGVGTSNTLLALAVGFTPGFARLVRGQTLTVRHQVYIEAARVVGVGDVRVMRRHVLPNVLPAIFTQAVMMMGFAFLAEAGLGFLGLSVQPPSPTLGTLLKSGFDSINVTQRPVMVVGLTITALSWCCNLVGDGLQRARAR